MVECVWSVSILMYELRVLVRLIHGQMILRNHSRHFRKRITPQHSTTKTKNSLCKTPSTLTPYIKDSRHTQLEVLITPFKQSAEIQRTHFGHVRNFQEHERVSRNPTGWLLLFSKAQARICISCVAKLLAGSSKSRSLSRRPKSSFWKWLQRLKSFLECFVKHVAVCWHSRQRLRGKIHVTQKPWTWSHATQQSRKTRWGL